MLGNVIRSEWRSVMRDRATWVVLAVFAALVAYATIAGARAVDVERAVIAAATAGEDARLDALRRDLAAIAAGGEVRHATDPRSPLLVGRELGRRAAVLPLGPLAQVAVGQRDLSPQVVEVSMDARREVTAADQGPARLSTGAFDLAFVLVFLLPLVVIALGYDLVAGERERGTLGLVLSQPVSLTRFVVGKALSRGLLLLGIAVVVGIGGPAILGGIGGAGVALAVYGALILAYTAFWFAATIAVNAYGRTAAGNALTLIGLWLGLVVVLPGLASVAVDAIHPPPSRALLVNRAREGAAEAEAKTTALEGDHAEDAARRAARTGARAVDVQDDLAASLAPVLTSFGDQLARQQALVDRLRFASPAIVLHEALADVAGSSVRRNELFRAQIDAFQAEQRSFFGERVRDAAELGTADHEAMPAFTFREEPTGALMQRAALGLLGLAVPTLALGVLAVARFRRPIEIEPR